MVRSPLAQSPPVRHFVQLNADEIDLEQKELAVLIPECIALPWVSATVCHAIDPHTNKQFTPLSPVVLLSECIVANITGDHRPTNSDRISSEKPMGNIW
jgi:hypothetical protein